MKINRYSEFNYPGLRLVFDHVEQKLAARLLDGEFSREKAYFYSYIRTKAVSLEHLGQQRFVGDFSGKLLAKLTLRLDFMQAIEEGRAYFHRGVGIFLRGQVLHLLFDKPSFAIGRAVLEAFGFNVNNEIQIRKFLQEPQDFHIMTECDQAQFDVAAEKFLEIVGSSKRKLDLPRKLKSYELYQTYPPSFYQEPDVMPHPEFT